MSVILTQSEWEGAPANEKRVRDGKPEVRMRRVEQGRWSFRWVRAAIFPDKQIRELSNIERAIN